MRNGKVYVSLEEKLLFKFGSSDIDPELLKEAKGVVRLVVRYTPRVLEEIEARFDKQRMSHRRQTP